MEINRLIQLVRGYKIQDTRSNNLMTKLLSPSLEMSSVEILVNSLLNTYTLRVDQCKKLNIPDFHYLEHLVDKLSNIDPNTTILSVRIKTSPADYATHIIVNKDQTEILGILGDK